MHKAGINGCGKIASFNSKSLNNYGFSIKSNNKINLFECFNIDIDKGQKIDAYWESINIFGFRDLENVVHYLLHNKKAFTFLKKFLNLELINQKKKLRINNIFFHSDEEISL